MPTLPRVAVLDDWQNVARASADWTPLTERAEVVFFERAFGSVEAAAEALGDFDVLLAMRERTAIPAALIARLPRLRMIALTGGSNRTLDMAACAAQGIVVSNTGGVSATAATVELTLALLLAAARHVPLADAGIRAGRFQEGVPQGKTLAGKTLGIIGLGRIGTRVARWAQALDMTILAWSQNMTAEQAQAAGARLVDKATLLRESDAVTLHLVLSERTRGILGEQELALMKPGAILVNTSRGPLIDEAALLAAVGSGRITAALDVYASEPLPPNHPLRTAPNTVLTPHLGYVTHDLFAQFYAESIENIVAFLTGTPIRVVTIEGPSQTTMP
jgi:phosphoglycerate dehydrogenase-like enzyme